MHDTTELSLYKFDTIAFAILGMIWVLAWEKKSATVMKFVISKEKVQTQTFLL
jgi:hypothetical protein